MTRRDLTAEEARTIAKKAVGVVAHGQDPTGIPVTRDTEWSMPDARRNVAGCAEEK